MTGKSPGHQQHPEHRVEENRAGHRVTIRIAGELIAESEDVIRVDEDGHPARYYFPRADVRMEKLQRSATTTACPFKGKASYYSVNAGGKHFADAVWTYEDPYDEHAALKERLAFYEERIPDLEVEPKAALWLA